MQWVGSVAATRAWRTAYGVRRAGALLVLALAGCTAGGQTPSFFAETRGNAVAVDSVDGPPAQVSQKFVRDLNEAASARQISVMPRDASAPYRLRGYLAVHSRGGATSIAWAWDIYDTAEHRAFRLTGEEPAKAGRRSWAAADDEVLGRVARSSVEKLAVFLANPRTPAGSAPEPSSIFADKGRTLLSRIDDFTPEASGIFRIFANKPPASDTGAEGSSAFPRTVTVPLPPDRPVPGAAASPALAYTDSER